MQTTDPLVRMKLRLPFTRLSLVPRARLQCRIIEEPSGLLTFVVAPAGFGKTTLAAASIADRGMQVAWLSLDQGDNQAGRFLAYLIAALQGADQEIALQLIVARGTIKAHAASIFRKLDVNNRTEAVSRARQLGILP